MSTAQNQNNLKAQNKKVIFIITFVGMLMLSLSYAAVPLYDIFCRVTGFGGTTQIAHQPRAVQVIQILILDLSQISLIL